MAAIPLPDGRTAGFISVSDPRDQDLRRALWHLHGSMLKAGLDNFPV